ncbi:MAG: VTT domain-containing protein [Bacteroidetes bacterium]|nr:VTT domain-containing protein [Bacteroidota bacterium]
MIEIFKHLWPLSIENFQWIFNNYGLAIYAILFLIIFIETGLVAMPFLPGDSLLFVAGFFARSGMLNISYLFLLLFAAAVLGDNCNYWIGRTFGLKVFNLKLRGKAIVKKEYLTKTEDFFEKYGVKAIVLARFVPFIRTFAPFAAGIGKMNYRKYLTFDIIGGALWIGSLTTAGYLLGEVEFIRKRIDLVCIGIVLISIAPVLITLLKKKLAKQQS